MERTPIPQFDIELKALLELIYLKYNYDFRHYSIASMKRTLVLAMNRMGCQTLPVLQEEDLLERTTLYATDINGNNYK